MWQQGLVFVFLPALCLLSGRATSCIVKGWRRALAPIAIALANAALFIGAPTFPLGGDGPKLLTVDTLRQHDASYTARIDAIRARFTPAHTLILSSQWRFPQYYLPAYRLLPYEIGARWEVDEGMPIRRKDTWIEPATVGAGAVGDDTTTLVLFDDDLQPFNNSAARQQWLPLADGERLAFMAIDRDERIHLGPRSFEITPAATANR
jgi:hypothetical protein